MSDFAKDIDVTNNDCISRQKAIYAIRAFYDEYIVYDNGKSIEDLISELPSAQPHWIPVTERLPDEMGTYLVTLDYKEHGTGVMSLWFHNEEIGWDLRVADEVTAWMPLPTPWKGEADG